MKKYYAVKKRGLRCIVYVFKSKKGRDIFVERHNNTFPIKKCDIWKYVDAPKPFSGKAKVIDTYLYDKEPDLIGIVTVYYPEIFMPKIDDVNEEYFNKFFEKKC